MRSSTTIFDPAKGSWLAISQIHASGIYAVRHPMQADRTRSPQTKPAVPSSSSSSRMPMIALGALVVLLFGGLATFQLRRGR